MRWICALLLTAGAATAQDARRDYAAQCAAMVGTIPDFSCSAGVVVPVTVDGETPAQYTPDMLCDRPGLLPNGAGSDGQCVPNSRILDLSQGLTQISVMCRQKKIRPAETVLYDEIDIIAHNAATGATCWFQAEASASEPLDGSNVPSPNSPSAGDFWHDPVEVASAGCGNCHDNDPFMYSPFVGQVWDQVPTDPFGPYFHVGPQYGFNAWPTDLIAPRDSTCTGCHRIGTEQTCGYLTELAIGQIIPDGSDALAQSYPDNHFMPPDHGLNLTAWEVIHQPSANKILECCLDSGQPSCNKQSINGTVE